MSDRIINFKDIVEENGKTIEQNNLEITHKIPIGTLCEFKLEQWYGDGACMKGIYRLYVKSHDRDCDGTPLYSLSQYPEGRGIDGRIIYNMEDGSQWEVKESAANSILNGVINGIPEYALTPIEITQGVLDGEGSLHWEEDEDDSL